MKEVSM